MPSSLREKFDETGYVLIASLFPASTDLESLRSACASTVSLARSGQWPYLRTLPKQFPPWPPLTADPESGIWGVQHLMHPDLPEHEVFAQSYFDDRIVNVVKELLQCEKDDLVMELYNLLIRPDRDFELRWHRDDIPSNATAEEEVERLEQHSWHAQWNLALYDDSSLIVVPGSHKRARTEAERNAEPYGVMPGQEIVQMKAGDVVFYDNNILHRGVYSSWTERMTLHGSIGHVKAGGLRARNVLQHGVGQWADQCDFGGLKGEASARAEGMRERLVVLGRGKEDVGFALEG